MKFLCYMNLRPLTNFKIPLPYLKQAWHKHSFRILMMIKSCQRHCWEFWNTHFKTHILKHIFWNTHFETHTLEFWWWLNLVNGSAGNFEFQITLLLAKLGAGKLAHNEREHCSLWSFKVYFQDTTQCHDFEYIWRVPLSLFGFSMSNFGSNI